MHRKKNSEITMPSSKQEVNSVSLNITMGVPGPDDAHTSALCGTAFSCLLLKLLCNVPYCMLFVLRRYWAWFVMLARDVISITLT